MKSENHNENRLRTLIPLERIEPEATAQIYENLARDFVMKMVILPDVHAGYDLPIGSAVLTDGVVSPSYVGYDIGCGMCMVDTGIPAKRLINEAGGAQRIFSQLAREIPAGKGGEHKSGIDYSIDFRSASGDRDLDRMVQAKVHKQLGTLGSGNHFIEVGKNLAGNLTVTIHSGSRNIGHSICTHYMKNHGRYLRTDSDSGRAYLQDLTYALEFALENRLTMIRTSLRALKLSERDIQKIIHRSLINENHNHAIVTEHGILHRKGATPADDNQAGVIPANMKEGVFVTRGLGNADYLSSASHGAGRVMSRKKAKTTLSLDAFKKSMKGITSRTDQSILDEAPQAYKDIDEVISMQQGVVIEVVDRARPIINLKG